MEEQPPIKARIIVEVAGWPEEHIAKTLNLVKEKFGAENKNIVVKKATIREPKKISDKAHSGFVEFEFTAERMTDLIGIVFDWMPIKSVIIIEPADLLDTNANFSDLLNDLSAKLHQYDALIKKLKGANILLQRDLSRLNSKVLSANEEVKELKKELNKNSK